MDYLQEFDRQIENLVRKNYPEEAVDQARGLKAFLKNIPEHDPDFDAGTLPFVTVVTSTLLDAEVAMTKIEKNGKPGLAKLKPLIASDFQTVTSVTLPKSDVYLLVDIDRGKLSLNVTPEKALIEIQEAGRSPLTIDEGIAIVTHYPEFLMKNNCFSLCASRHPGDQRVPAIWINANKQANLGWCWDRNPHTWLGSASCGKRFS